MSDIATWGSRIIETVILDMSFSDNTSNDNAF